VQRLAGTKKYEIAAAPQRAAGAAARPHQVGYHIFAHLNGDRPETAGGADYALRVVLAGVEGVRVEPPWSRAARA
jgi:hypothetical protein